MKYKLHEINSNRMVEIISNDQIICEEKDVIILMEELYSTSATIVILQLHHLSPDFFDLKNGLAGAILNKLSTYQWKVAIIGDFDHVSSKALKAFIYESNKGGQTLFLPSVEEAIKRFSH